MPEKSEQHLIRFSKTPIFVVVAVGRVGPGRNNDGVQYSYKIRAKANDVNPSIDKGLWLSTTGRELWTMA